MRVGWKQGEGDWEINTLNIEENPETEERKAVYLADGRYYEHIDAPLTPLPGIQQPRWHLRRIKALILPQR